MHKIKKIYKIKRPYQIMLNPHNLVIVTTTLQQVLPLLLTYLLKNGLKPNKLLCLDWAIKLYK